MDVLGTQCGYNNNNNNTTTNLLLQLLLLLLLYYYYYYSTTNVVGLEYLNEAGVEYNQDDERTQEHEQAVQQVLVKYLVGWRTLQIRLFAKRQRTVPKFLHRK